MDFKTKKNMKQTRILFTAALFAMGALVLSCNKIQTEEEIVPAQDNIVTLNISVGFSPETKALTDGGVKTFAAGDRIAVIYKNTTGTGETVKAVSDALASGGSATATFTVTLTNPATNSAVRYIYPAAMAVETPATGSDVNAEANVNYAALGAQDGTLTAIESNYDLAIYDGTLSGTDLPTGSQELTNQLALAKFTIKDSGSNDITSNITRLYVSDGTNGYYITPSSQSTIWVAMKPVEGETFSFNAFNGTVWSTKSTASAQTIEKSKIYPISVTMGAALTQGALPGVFSVDASNKVRFSQGNLQYMASSDGTWRFAEHQYDYVGDDTEGNVYVDETKSNNASVSSSYAGWIDLFGWGTSGSAPSGQTARDPYYTTLTNTDYVPNITTNGESWGENSEWDWGHNTISNGGNAANTWKTLSSAEWTYIFDNTSERPATRYAKAFLDTDSDGIGDVHGMILFPDGYVHPAGLAAVTGINTPGNTSWDANKYNADAWAAMEAAGAVFLPAAGYRYGTDVYNVGSLGYYWSSTANYADYAYSLYFFSSYVNPAYSYYRYSGYSVRLVQNLN